MALVYKYGNIFDSNCQTLVNTVNCQGMMGKGLAKQFKQFFPTMYYSYVEECKYGTSLKHGGDLWVYSYENTHQLTLWEDLDPNHRSKILCFATKEHWRYPSKLEWIDRGLEEFVKRYKEWGITSIAFPKLGCTNGGLDWDRVQWLMEHHLSKLNIQVEIWLPEESTCQKHHIQ